MTFIMHKGAREVEREDIAEYLCPAPTKTHFPVCHFAFLEAAIDAASRFDFVVTHERHALWGDNDERYFGLLTLSNEDDSWSPVIGLRNANDKAFSLRLTAGNSVFICDNLMMTGEVDETRKHSKNVNDELGYLMWKTMQRLAGLILSQGQRIERYKECEIGYSTVCMLLVEAMRKGIISSQQIKKVYDAYYSGEEMHGTNTTWAVQNAFTEVLKGRVIGNPKSTIMLTQMLDTQSDYAEAA